jgi:hypothetical protein
VNCISLTGLAVSASPKAGNCHPLYLLDSFQTGFNFCIRHRLTTVKPHYASERAFWSRTTSLAISSRYSFIGHVAASFQTTASLPRVSTKQRCRGSTTFLERPYRRINDGQRVHNGRLIGALTRISLGRRKAENKNTPLGGLLIRRHLVSILTPAPSQRFTLQTRLPNTDKVETAFHGDTQSCFVDSGMLSCVIAISMTSAPNSVDVVLPRL